MTDIDPNKFVYIRRSIQLPMFQVIKHTLLSHGIEEKHILNVEATIHAQIGDYVAYVNESADPPKLLLGEVLETKDGDPNILDSHHIKTKTICEFDLQYR